MSPFVASSAIAAGADIIGSAFGKSGNSIGRRAKDQERLQNVRSKYDKRVNKQTLKLDRHLRYRDKKTTAYNYENYQSKVAQVRDAKAAGLHPLFAMGATGNQAISAGAPRQSSSSGSPAPTGQSPTGSFAGDGLRAVSGHFNRIAEVEASKELVMAQAQASAMRIAENNTSNDQEALRDIVLSKDTTLTPRTGVSTIKAIEEVYGEVADIVGGVRFVEDLIEQSTVPSIEKIYKETIKWMRGQTGIQVTSKIKRLQAKQALLVNPTQPAFKSRKQFLGK